MKKFYAQKSLLLLALCCFHAFAWSQIPEGYYDAATGYKERELKTALFHIITQNLTPPSYGKGERSTWAAFEKTDVRPDGTVWDMYSTNVRYFTGNGQSVSGLNIEHSMANSWWGGIRNNAYNDILQLRPSDAAVNSSKSNYIMSVVNYPNSDQIENSLVTIGYTTLTPGGYTLAWEPDDEYKGDFARIYMYMVTCYEDFGANNMWKSRGLDQLENNTYPVFQDWTTRLLLQWNEQDPVSEKEETLNNEAYKIQGNRNPFIDYPELAEYIWGDLRDKAFDPDEATTPRTKSPEFSIPEGYYESTFTLSLSCPTENAEIYYTLDGTDPSKNSERFAAPIQISDEVTIVKAIACAENQEDSRIVTATYYIGKDPTVAESIRKLRTFNPDNSTSYTLILDGATVTYNDNRYLFLQDDEAAICIYGWTLTKPGFQIGDKVHGEIYGKLTSFNSLLEMTSPIFDLNVISSGIESEPITISINELQDNFENYDSHLIRLNDVTFESTDFQNNNVSIRQDNSGFITCRNQFNTVLGELPNTKVDLTGIAIPYYNNKQIALRGNFDIITATSGMKQTGEKAFNVRTSGNKIILSADTPTVVEVTDIVGRQVLKVALEAEEKEIALPSGLYIVNGIKIIL